MEKIPKKRQSEGEEPEYLIAWKGWEHQTWEKAEALVPGAKDSLTELNIRNDPMASKTQKNKRKGPV